LFFTLVFILFIHCTLLVAQLVEALRQKPEGCAFDSQWCHNPSDRTMMLGLTHMASA